MRLIIACAAAALLLSACATLAPPEPVVITKTVEVPVPVACHPTVVKPAFVDTDILLGQAVTDYAWVQRLKAGRVQHLAYEALEEAALAACEAAGASASAPALR